MKKFLSLILSFALIASLLTACGDKPTGNSEPSAPDDASAPSATTADDDNSKKIAVICNTGGLGDKSFNDSTYAGLMRAAEDFGIEYTIVEPNEIAQGETYLRQFAEAGYGAVVTLEYSHAEYIESMADEYPNTVFVATDQEVSNKKALSIIFDYHQSSYLAGLAAGLIASGDYPIIDGVADRAKNTIGVICALESDGFHNFTEAFTQGAKAGNPDVTVLYDWSVGFTDTQLSKQIAENMINNQNADVVFQVCGLAGLGILQACAENNAFAIGVDSDQDYIEPGRVLTSVIKDMGAAVYKVSEMLINGTLEGGVLALPLGDGTEITEMTEIAQYVTNQEAFDALKAEIETARQAILSGEIVVVHGALGERFEG